MYRICGAQQHAEHQADLWVELCNKGVIVQALTDVALHMAAVLRGQRSQALQQLWRACGHKARRDHRLHQGRSQIPAQQSEDTWLFPVEKTLMHKPVHAGLGRMVLLHTE